MKDMRVEVKLSGDRVVTVGTSRSVDPGIWILFPGQSPLLRWLLPEDAILIYEAIARCAVHATSIIRHRETPVRSRPGARMKEHKVRVDHGKYTFVVSGGYKISILRHGEPWIGDNEILGGKAVMSILADLDAARVVLQAAREAINVDVWSAKSILREAINRHDALVDDREPPSDWTKP